MTAILGNLADPTWLLASFAGGAFGAAIGALPAFIFTGFMVIAGQATAAIGISPTDGAGQTATDAAAGLALSSNGFTGPVGFGPVFGPHISFAAGAAAAAYAAKKGYIDDGKNILWAAGTNNIDVLVVGGVFGVFGLASQQILNGIGVPTDNIALTVYISAFVHRIAFGYSIIGEVTGDGLFDVGPWERDEDEAPGIWLPWQYQWSGVAMLGLIGGLLGGFLYQVTGSALIGFGISAASLVFLQCGVDNIPVTHHITLPGSVGALGAASGGLSPVAVLLFGALFGIFGAVMGEVLERLFYMHGETHVDPPAGAIFLSGFLATIFAIAGVFDVAFWTYGDSILGALY